MYFNWSIKNLYNEYKNRLINLNLNNLYYQFIWALKNSLITCTWHYILFIYCLIIFLFINFQLVWFSLFNYFVLFIWSFYLVIISPLVSIIGNWWLGFKGIKIITTGNLVCATLLIIESIILLQSNGVGDFQLFLNLFGFVIVRDSVTLSFLSITLSKTFILMQLLVCCVSACVHYYSWYYMDSDPKNSQFFILLSCFTMFMVLFITAESLLQAFLGWEGIGLVSYLLISFWDTRVEANKSAMKAMIINRIGDVCFLLAICLIVFYFNSTNFSNFLILVPYFNSVYISLGLINFKLLNCIGFFLFIGVIGKSAQIGLHMWLPDAMEGPTPVSALIHAATMVTAGIFLIIKCSLLFNYTPIILILFILFGGLTSFFAASVALVQYDIKKIIAYSTCSQLGYMLFICGFAYYNVGYFHLFNHGFFKALLFLSAGSIIHSVVDEQDLRKLGGLIYLLPITYISCLIGSLALMGIPYFSGFYSKDFILELSYTNSFFLSGRVIFWLGCISAFCTASYSFRLFYLTFLNITNLPLKKVQHIYENSLEVLVVLSLLLILSCVVGFLFVDEFIGFGNSYGFTSLIAESPFYLGFEAEFLPLFIKLLPLILTILGMFITYLYYTSHITNLSILNWVSYNFLYFYFFFLFLSDKWFFDKLYNTLVYKVLKYSYTIFYVTLDKGLFELMSSEGVRRLFINMVYPTRFIYSGNIFHYLLIILFIFLNTFWYLLI